MSPDEVLMELLDYKTQVDVQKLEKERLEILVKDIRAESDRHKVANRSLEEEISRVISKAKDVDLKCDTLQKIEQSQNESMNQ